MFIKYLCYTLQRGHSFDRSVREGNGPALLSDHTETQGYFSQGKKKKKSSKDGHKKVAFYFVPENKKAKVIL